MMYNTKYDKKKETEIKKIWIRLSWPFEIFFSVDITISLLVIINTFEQFSNAV